MVGLVLIVVFSSALLPLCLIAMFGTTLSSLCQQVLRAIELETANRKALEEERERCAAALDEHQEGGHEGEETFSMIVRQRVSRVLKQASEIIRALPSPQVKP